MPMGSQMLRSLACALDPTPDSVLTYSSLSNQHNYHQHRDRSLHIFLRTMIWNLDEEVSTRALR